MWQEGRHHFEVVLPADKTKSGIEEQVRAGFSWKVVATGPMSARDWTRWEFDSAREILRRAVDGIDGGEEFTVRHEEDLRSALTHAVRAWCRTHLRCKDARRDDGSYYSAFGEKAPEDLYHTALQARAADHPIDQENKLANPPQNWKRLWRRASRSK